MEVYNKTIYRKNTCEIRNCDCFELMATMQDNSLDCILTDPPYCKLDHKIEDGFSLDKVEPFLNECYRVLKPQGWLIYFGMQPTLTDWNYIANKLFVYKKEFIWRKSQVGFSCLFDKCPTQHENIMIFCKKNTKTFNEIKEDFIDYMQKNIDFIEKESLLRYIGFFRTFTKTEERFEKMKIAIENKNLLREDLKSKFNDNLYKKNNEVDRQICGLKSVFNGVKQKSVLSFQTENQKTRKGDGFKHPTCKPTELIDYLIILCTQPNDLIMDCFLGSGTTAIATLKEGRNFIGCEILPEYYKMSIDRVEKEFKQDMLL